MLILVTGATGLIGQALVEELIANPDNYLRLSVRDSQRAKTQFGALDLNRIELIECDFTKLTDNNFDDLTRDCHSIIHLAGLVHQGNASYEKYDLLNVQTTQRLILSAVANAVDTFVLMSTSAVYGDGPFFMAPEDTPLSGQTPYAVSKIACEEILNKATNIKRRIILRPALVFGKGDRGNLIKLIRSIKRRYYFQIGNGNTAKSLIYANDVAKAITLCLKKLSAGTYVFNVANPQPVTTKELAKEISIGLGRNGYIPAVPESIIYGAIKAADLIVSKCLGKRFFITVDQITKLTTTTTYSIDKLQLATGFSPQESLSSALQAEIDWIS